MYIQLNVTDMTTDASGSTTWLYFKPGNADF